MSSIITQGFGAAVLLTQGMATSTFGTGGMSQGGSPQSVPPAVIGRDAFTGTAGTALEAHTPDAGGSWIANAANSGNKAILDSANRVRNGSTGLVAYTLSASPATAGQSVQADVVYLSQNIQSYDADVTARFSATSITGYSGGYNSASQVWHVSRWNSGTEFPLATMPAILAAGNTYTANLFVQGSSLSLYVNGALMIGPVADATPITAIGNVGILFRVSGTTGDTDTTGAHLDNFIAQGSGASIDVVAQYDLPVSGGARQGGMSVYTVEAQPGATGGMALGGARVFVGSLQVSPSGGMCSGGASSASRGSVVSGAGGTCLGGIAGTNKVFSVQTSGGSTLGGVGSTAQTVGLVLGPQVTLGGASIWEATPLGVSPIIMGLGTGHVLTQGYAARVPIAYSNASTGGIVSGGSTTVTAVYEDGAGGGIAQGGSFIGVPIVYHVYMNAGQGDPINYANPVAAVTAPSWTSEVLTAPGEYKLGVRAFNPLSGLEEQNVDAVVEVVLDAGANDVTRVPLAPLGPRALALAGGSVRLEWTCSCTDMSRQPLGFHVYVGGGTAPDYTTPVTTVSWSDQRQGCFTANLSNLTDDVTYAIGVRAFNAVGEEKNTVVLTIKADADPPSVVDALEAAATNREG